jgi:formate dehydrogenase major subunit
MMIGKRLLNTPLERCPTLQFTLDGVVVLAAPTELLIEVINRELPKRALPQVCFHPQLGSIESCDTCMVEVDGQLVRARSTHIPEFYTRRGTAVKRIARHSRRQVRICA